MIIHSFVKCGITNNLDGSEDDQVNIRGLEDYKMPLPEEEYHLQMSSEEEEDDEDCYLTDASTDVSVSNPDSDTESSENDI
jgi:hypothetical protein